MNQQISSLPARYDVLDTLGGGGGGNVYRVFDKHLKLELALKMFAPDGTGKAADEDSFRSEFLLSATLSHPNLVKVYDFGFDSNNQPFFTMEPAGGREIDSVDVLRSDEFFLNVMGQTCSALALLHHFGYSHNDLKPANIKVDVKEGEPTAKILDFGLAREYDPSQAKELSGTVEYMAPEMFRSEPSSKLSDIYSLGILLYELLSGQHPYADSDPLAVISGHIEKDLPPLESEVRFVNEDLAELVHRMLEKDPSARPQSVVDVYNGIATALGAAASEESPFHIMPYFESSLLHQILKTREYHSIAASGKTGIKVVCTDRKLVGLISDLAKGVYQTKFINVVADRDRTSDTCVHSPDAIVLGNCEPVPTESQLLPSVSIINAGTYGEIDSKYANVPIISGDALIPPVAEAIFGSGEDSTNTIEALLHISCGDTEIVQSIINRLYRKKNISLQWDHFLLNEESLMKLLGQGDTRQSILNALKPLDSGGLEYIKSISIFDHPFTLQMASAVVSECGGDADLDMQKYVRMRILARQDDLYEFRHWSIQRLLVEQLDPSQRKRLHGLIADLLTEDEHFEESEQAGVLSKHLLLAGRLESGIDKAVAYLRMQLERGEVRKPEALLNLCDRTLSESELRDGKLESRLLMAFGDLYKQQGRADTALEAYTKITKMTDVELSLLAETYKDLGDIHKTRQNPAAGIEALGKALDIYGRLDNQLEISHTLNNMGNLYWIDSQYDLALHQYESALKIQEQLDSIRDVASTLTNIGSTYFAKGEYLTAIEYYTRSVELKKQIDDQPELARTYNNVALAYSKIGESGKALNYLNRAMVINRKIGARKELLYNLENTADVCLGLGENHRAEELSVEGLSMARELDDLPHQGFFASWLGLLHFRRGMYGRSLECVNAAETVFQKITDKPMQARNLLQKAQTYIELNALDAAEETLQSVRKLISPIAPDENLVRLKLLAARHALKSGEDPTAVIRALDEVDREAGKLELGFERCESLVTRLKSHSIQARIPAEPLETLDRLTELDQHTIYRSYLYFYLGLSSAFDRLHNEALSYFDQASLMATAYEQRELLWKINFHLGKVHLSKLEYEAAFRSLREGGSILKEIAAGIGDKELLKGYMRLTEIQEYLDTVKHLEARLA